MLLKLNRILIVFFMALFFTACNDNETEQLFDDSSTIRKEKREQELRDLLVSSTNGWKTTYFTDNTLLGGFTFLFKFKNETKVEMISDFTNNYSVVESEYDVFFSSTTKLSFTSKNIIHDLSDSNNSPDGGLTGSGYKGDFEFLYYGTDGDDIIFRTNRDFIELRFKKATPEDWTDIEKHEPMKPNVASQEGKSVFRTLKVGEEVYNFSYNVNRRFATNTKADNTNLNFGVGFTPSGIIIDPAIDVNGQDITEFLYDSVNDKFVATLDGNTVASIEYATSPAIPLTGYDDLTDFFDLNYFFNIPPILDNNAFTEYLDNYQETNAFIGLVRIAVRNLDKDSGDVVLVTNGFGNFFYSFNKTIENDKVYLSRSNSNGPGADAIFKPLLDLFFDENGLYVEKVGTLDDFINQTFTFVPASNTILKYSFFNR